jgi:hypothetical protein
VTLGAAVPAQGTLEQQGGGGVWSTVYNASYAEALVLTIGFMA